MNAVEIEEAVSDLAGAPFDPQAFPYAFLTAFGMKDATIARLRKGDTNASDMGGVLQRSNIHIALAVQGGVGDTLRALRESPKTAAAKAKFILATDGDTLEAEDLISGEPLACLYSEFAEHFGFFLPLAGISTVKELKNNPIDVKATGRLNRLYVELLKENPDWGSPARRHDLNQFMARLIFCYFAEDTGIFNGTNLFTSTIERMSTTEAGSVEHVLTELFRAMDTAPEKRSGAKLRSWADAFPWVNGGLFAGGKPCPKFSKIARSYLLRAGELNWQEINPDIFGSMIQAVADDGERGSLGMHYTSVPNIMKVLGPLFLDDLRTQLEMAGDNVRKLRNLRKRLANIRVFDPACGSGNFLVIAYIRMREVEYEIVKLTKDEPRSVIPLANFYGIEIKDFAAEVARLALLIAEFQCDVRFINQQVARSLVLPLKETGQIKTDNALRIDWLQVCPPAETRHEEHDLAGPTGRLALETGFDTGSYFETYICGNPPFSGTRKQTEEQKKDLQIVFANSGQAWKNVDYVGAWFVKAAEYNTAIKAQFCFVATNSFCQGQQVPITWAILKNRGFNIRFAHASFSWKNLASKNAGVTVIVVCVDRIVDGSRYLFYNDVKKSVDYINPYLTEHKVDIVEGSRRPIFSKVAMEYGVYYSKSEGLMLSFQEIDKLIAGGFPKPMYRKFLGSTQFINGVERFCLWLEDSEVDEACAYGDVAKRIENVRKDRLATSDRAVNRLAARPHQFRERKGDEGQKIFVPIVSSENREYFPAGLADSGIVPTNKAFYVPEGPLWALAVIISKVHMIWIATVCGRLRNDFSYSNVLGWNTFPMPELSNNDKNQLTICARNILIAREEHFPATLADLYEPDKMPANLRQAHDANDEVLERIYIGRCFRNDTERLSKLFDMYSKTKIK